MTLDPKLLIRIVSSQLDPVKVGELAADETVEVMVAPSTMWSGDIRIGGVTILVVYGDVESCKQLEEVVKKIVTAE